MKWIRLQRSQTIQSISGGQGASIQRGTQPKSAPIESPRPIYFKFSMNWANWTLLLKRSSPVYTKEEKRFSDDGWSPDSHKYA